MKKLIAITVAILVFMCFIIVFNSKDVESAAELGMDNNQVNQDEIFLNNINFEDKHNPEPDIVENTDNKIDGSKIQETKPTGLDENIEQKPPVESIKTDVKREIDKKRTMVALTFDDGPHPEYTMNILDSLKKHKGLATFFVLGSRAEKFKSVINSITESGSQIGNHTYEHKELTRLGSKAITNEITKTASILKNITNIETNIVRPTYGSVNDKVKLYAGAPLILWSIDTLDWKTKNKKMIVNEVLGKVKDGDIILMHDIYKTTAMAAEVIIKELSSSGFQLVTIDELYTARGIDLVNGKVYSSANVKK